MKDRIKQVRRHPKIAMSQEAFGARLGVTGAAISRMESGVNNPSEQVILSICREFNVSERWLRTGEGEMFVETAEDSLRAVVREYGLDESDYGMLAEFVELPPADRKALIAYMRRVIARIDKISPPQLSPKPPQEMTDAELLTEFKRQLKDEQKAAEAIRNGMTLRELFGLDSP